MPMPTRWQMTRPLVLSLIGLAAVISALLYVANGVGHEMVWTYARCVAWQSENCFSGDRMSVHCNHVAMICLRTEPSYQPWVFSWLQESAVSAGGILLFAVLRRHDERTGPIAIRLIAWSILAGLGYAFALDQRLKSSGHSLGDIYSFVAILLGVSATALVVLVLTVLVARFSSARLFSGISRIPWLAIALIVLVVGSACGWFALGLQG